MCHSVNRITDECGNGRRPNLVGVTLQNFGGDPDPHLDSRSLFHFLHYYGIGDSWTFVSISHTVKGRFVLYLVKSSRMRVMNHNWSATKQHLHPQSVDKVSRHSVLSGDTIGQCGTSSGSRHKDTDQCL